MNLLFVTDVFPYPPLSGSAVISFHWARELAQRHKILLFSASPAEDAEAREYLHQVGIHVVASERAFIHPRGIRHAASWVPMAMHRIRARELFALVDQVAKERQADGIVVIGTALAAFMQHRKSTLPVIFVPYDAESVNFEMRTRQGRNALRRAYFRIEVLKWQFVEARYFRMADACVAVTQEDGKAISRCWPMPDRRRIRIVPNGVDTEYFAPQPSFEEVDRILITGNMQAPDTLVSTQWFLHKVLPRIRRQAPGVGVDIVGRGPLPALRVMAMKAGGVTVWGYVPDLRPHFAQATVYVAPLVLGSGVKNRVLEAMAMSKAVVTTPLGTLGLRVQPGRHVITASEEGAFADAVVDLLRSRERRREMGQAAREAIVAHHSWSTIGSCVESLVEDVIAVNRQA